MKKITSILLALLISVSVLSGLSINAYASSTTIKEITGSYSNNLACRINVEYNTTLRIVFKSNYVSEIEYNIQEYYSDYEIEGGGLGKSYSENVKVNVGDYLDVYVSLPEEDIPGATYSLKVFDLKGLHKNSKNFKVGEPRFLHYKYDENERCKWSTSNKKVATVSSEGEINPKNLGTCTIECKNRQGKVTKFKIKVNQKAVYGKKKIINFLKIIKNLVQTHLKIVVFKIMIIKKVII